MRLKFTKMQGAGNDFMVIDATAAPVDLDGAAIRNLADRHFGVGFDQMLVVEPARTPDTDFFYRIFNADGGEVSQCGNGARCFVRFVHDRKLTAKPAIRVETKSGIIEPRLEKDGRVTVNMGAPEFEPRRIPFDAPARAPSYVLDLETGTVEVFALSMGNPHAVQLVRETESAPVLTEGPQIERHARFPERVNAGYMQVVGRHEIHLRVFERGAGETLACGTGACAAVVAGIMAGRLDSPVRVHTRGGDLEIAWQGEGRPVWMTGPAQSVFEGEIEL